jgi:hypothetical protein
MRALAITILALTAGCGFDVPSGRFKCDATHACPPGQSCVEGLCEGPDDGQNCPPLAAPANGSVSASTAEAGGTVTYQCDADFELVGDATLTCTESLSWSGTAPECVASCLADMPAECDRFAGIETSGASCLGDPGPETPLRYRVRNLYPTFAGEGLGFDLDCYETDASDAYGCMRADAPGGIDNGLGGLAELLTGYGFYLWDNYWVAVEDLGSIRIEIVVVGWNAAYDDDCVAVGFQFWLPDEGLWSEVGWWAPGVVEGGVLKVGIDVLPWPVPMGEPSNRVFFTTLRGVRLEAYITPTDITEGRLGGHVNWDDSAGGDLESLVSFVAESIGAPELSEIAASVAMSQLDIHVPGVSASACECDALSVSMFIGHAD